MTVDTPDTDDDLLEQDSDPSLAELTAELRKKGVDESECEFIWNDEMKNSTLEP